MQWKHFKHKFEQVQHWFHDEQRAQFMWSLTSLVWSGMILDTYLTAGGWLYL